jgi:hypothetical protein
MALLSAKIKQVDLEQLPAVCDQLLTHTLEILAEMIDTGCQPTELSDYAFYVSAQFDGFLQAREIPYEIVKQRVADFQTSCEGWLMERLPQIPPAVWEHPIIQLASLH